MYDEAPRCFKCGEQGHIKVDCPKRRTPAAKAPDAAPADAGGSVNKVHFETGEDGKTHLFVDIPGYRQGPPADAHSWANRIREADPRMGTPHCGDPADLSETEFRRVRGMQAEHECRLREQAAQQVQEAREDRSGTAAA